jgi:predicted permease
MANFLINLDYFLRTNSYIFIVLGVWEIFWKGLALWKASQNKQRNWFIAILVINTIGILPIIYLKFFQRKLKINPPAGGKK